MKDGICVFDTCTKSAFEFSDVFREVSVENTFDPSHAPFLHNGISKYSPDKAGGPMRQRRFDEVKIGTWLGSVDGEPVDGSEIRRSPVEVGRINLLLTEFH